MHRLVQSLLMESVTESFVFSKRKHRHSDGVLMESTIYVFLICFLLDLFIPVEAHVARQDCHVIYSVINMFELLFVF